MDKILENLSSTLRALKSKYPAAGASGGGGFIHNNKHKPLDARSDDDETVGTEENNDARKAVSLPSASGSGSMIMGRGWLRYPGWVMGYGRKKWAHHFLVRCALLVVVVLIGLSIVDWLEQRRVISAITGLRGLTPSQTAALKKRTWKHYFISQGIRALLVSVVVIVVLCLWMDPSTIP